MLRLTSFLFFALFIGLNVSALAADKPKISRQMERLNIAVASLTSQTNATKMNIEQVRASVSQLQLAVQKLETQQQSESNNIQRTLDTADRAVSWSNIVLTILAVGIGVATALFQWWSSRDKKQAIKDAQDLLAKDIGDKLSIGLLPSNSKIKTKLLEKLFSSQEFNDAHRKATEAHQKRLSEEQQATQEIAGEVVTEQNISEASGT